MRNLNKCYQSMNMFRLKNFLLFLITYVCVPSDVINNGSKIESFVSNKMQAKT